jgi:UDP-N-acetylmuramoyl-L-alanyl-D-glutamate--2,6-diaminopimelate ligase
VPIVAVLALAVVLFAPVHPVPEVSVSVNKLSLIIMMHRAAITIGEILSSLPEDSFRFEGDSTQEILSITWDYQNATAKSLYFCLENEEFQEAHIETNALDYWEKAVHTGAVCLVAERNAITAKPQNISLIEVENLNRSMAIIAQTFYGDPLSDMKVIGVTGTNGKTTTTQLLDSIFGQIGAKTGVVGTIGVFFPSGKQKASHLSNPMSTELFQIGQQMADEEVEYLTMEVTSHAMAFERNHAIDYDIAIFTNLTQDHLDYHKTLESYKKSKLKYFQQLGKKQKKSYGIINIDDANSNEFIEAIDKHLRVIGKAEVLTYSVRNKDADLVAYPREMTGSYSIFDIYMRGNHLSQIQLPMPGLFNIYNALAAFGAAFALGISIEQIVEGLANARKVDGRFETVECPADFDVYVDYAHTPDSLTKILEEIRSLTKKRVIVVFGCGGDRDRSKRKEMGRIGSELADISVVTSDNPRTEEPNQIIHDIVAGISADSVNQHFIEPDRRRAIYLALENASTDDAVLIAGKGHETYQIIGQTTYPFFDRRVVQDFFLSAKKYLSRAWLEVNLKTLTENFQLIFKDKPDHLKVLVVVKDNALGHGVLDVAGAAVDAGADYLGVACLSEALTVRKSFEKIPLLVFGERSEDEIPICVQHNISIQIQSVQQAELVGRISGENGKRTRVHLKVDTGMGRYGIAVDEAVDAFSQIARMEGIHAEGIMTHFAQADEADKTYANAQWQKFQDVLSGLEKKKLLPPLIHACNSGGYLDLPHAHGNMVRIGILPTGVYPSKVCRRIEIDGQTLHPVMSAKTRVAFVKTLQKGESTGYGMHFKAERETRVAILAVGYGDGYPRLRNTGFVIIHGQTAAIVGGNGMDATMVDVTDIPDVQKGNEVVLLGRQGEKEITAMMVADWAGTVTYDILSRWTNRMERKTV